MAESTVEKLRELAERSAGRTVSLPVEMVNLIEGMGSDGESVRCMP